MMALFSTQGFSSADGARLRRIERKLDLIIDHLGICYDDAAQNGLPNEVRSLADDGRKIAAIKVHRQLLGSSLVEAKRAVEDYLSQK